MATHEGSPEHRMWLFKQYHEAIVSEVVPAIHADSGDHEIIVTGSSIGAFNALGAASAAGPQLFRAAVCMSGSYHMEKFIGGFNDDLYFSSPLHFLPGLDGPQLDLLRQRFVVLRPGSGALGEPRRGLGGGRPVGQQGDSQPAGRLGPGATTTTGRPGGRCSRPTCEQLL